MIQANTPRRKRLAALGRTMGRQWPLFVMLTPALAWVLIFCYYPMYGAQIAFRDYKIYLGILESPWVGMKNFMDFFKSYYFVRCLTNTLTLSLYMLAANFVVVLILSLMIHCLRGVWTKKIVQTAVYLPHFISTVVIVSIVMRMLNPNLGVLSKLIQGMGGTNADLMGVPSAFAHIYVISGLWQNAGWGTIIYLATLTGVDPQQHEAAMIDGATRFQRVLHVDIPAVIPTAIIMLILNCGKVINVGSEKVLLMQNTLNLSKSEIISTYVYKIGIASSTPQYSLSSAVGLFNSVVNFILVITVNKVSQIYTETSLW